MSKDDIVERMRESWISTDIRTHYEGCWDNHAGCAVALLLDEIERLQGLLADHGYHGPDCKFGNCWCGESKERR